MIWTLLMLALTVLCLVLYKTDISDFFAPLGAFMFGFVLCIMLVHIVLTHTYGVSVEIENTKYEYQSLVKRAELIDSNYEDVSKNTLIKDITKWNKQARSDKYWSENLWTSWFWNKKIVAEEKIIELD